MTSDPVTSDPATSDPATSDPATSDPVTSDPTAADPVVFDAVVSGAKPDSADDDPSAVLDLDVLHGAALDGMREELAAEARAYARRVDRMLELARLGRAGAAAGVAQFPQLEMAGSWHISQLTATRWIEEAERYSTCLPVTLQLLADGVLFVGQAQQLLHRTRHCSEDIARAVDARVLPDGAMLCPSDLRKRIDRAVLQLEAATLEPDVAEQRHAQAVAGRRTFSRPELDGMGSAGAVLTAEQLVCWQHGLDLLERRERTADRHAGIDRTAEQRRADLFAALPALVLAGTAQDRTAPATTSTTGGGEMSPGSLDRAGRSEVDGGSACPCGRTAATGCCLASYLIGQHQPQPPGPATADAAGDPAARREAAQDEAANDDAAGDDALHVQGDDGLVPERERGCAAGAALAAASVGLPLTTPGEPLQASPATSPTGPGGTWVPWTLDGGQVAAQIVLNVHVPVATVLDLSHQPGTLDRYGPISATHVRLVRPHSVRRVMVNADSGIPIAQDDRPRPVAADPTGRREKVLAMLQPAVVVDPDEPQHDPSAGLARLVDLRDVHCCGPGCSSTRTDRDHLVAHPAGPTSARNLGRLSRRCHLAKHHGWTLTRHLDGSTSWTSPLGRTYTRPGPHSPPPQVDLTQPLPPLRPPPRAEPVHWATGAEARPSTASADDSSHDESRVNGDGVSGATNGDGDDESPAGPADQDADGTRRPQEQAPPF